MQELDECEESLRERFDALAERNSSFYTRNAHYIDGGKAEEVSMQA